MIMPGQIARITICLVSWNIIIKIFKWFKVNNKISAKNLKTDIEQLISIKHNWL